MQVIHGSDSMMQTGQVLASIQDKTLVMTGALSPARFRGSDAEFNIGGAIGAVQAAAGGRVHRHERRIGDPVKVRQNVTANRFEAVWGCKSSILGNDRAR